MGGKSSAPASPDFTAAAQEQGQQSQQLATQQTYANRPDINTPWGNLSYTQGTTIDPATGKPVTTWNENAGLTPAEQTAVGNQQGIQAGLSSTANNLLTGVNGGIVSTPGTVPQDTQMTGAGQGINYNPAMLDPAAEEATWNQFQNMELPLQQQQTEQQNSQLEAQGLRPGDAGYDTASKNLENTQFTQDQTAADQAVLAGEAQASNLFNEGNAAQAQGFGQDFSQLGYNNSLIPQNISNQNAELGLNTNESMYLPNLINGLESGNQVGMPQFPGTTSASSGQPTQYLSAAEQQYQSALDAYNAQNSSQNNLFSGLAGLAGSGMMAYGLAASGG